MDVVLYFLILLMKLLLHLLEHELMLEEQQKYLLIYQKALVLLTKKYQFNYHIVMNTVKQIYLLELFLEIMEQIMVIIFFLNHVRVKLVLQLQNHQQQNFLQNIIPMNITLFLLMITYLP